MDAGLGVFHVVLCDGFVLVIRILAEEGIQVVLLHPEFLAGQGNHVRRAVHVFLIVPVFDEIVFPGAEPLNLLCYPSGSGLQAEFHARLVQFLVNQVQSVDEILFFFCKGREEEHILSLSRTDEKDVILHGPLRVVGFLPEEEGVECAVNLLIMVNFEKPSISGLSSMRNDLNSMMSISLYGTGMPVKHLIF